MSILDKLINTEKTSQMTITNPRELYGSVLKQLSGSSVAREVRFDIFYQIIAFKGIAGGVGCSTLVANTALAIADLGLTVCVVDTCINTPVQDILLKTNYKNKVENKEKRLDWFDMPYTKISVLHESSLRKNISVLSFWGKDRGVVDALSTSDTAELVDLAFTELHNKFDIILVDCCEEMTSVNTAALQQSQHVIQVWNDAPQIVYNIDNFINNCATLSCPLDKMRNVVFSGIVDDVIGGLDELANQYRLTKLAQTRFSKDVQRVAVLGKPLYQYASNNEDIINFTEAILALACHICNIRPDDGDKYVKSQDIMDGKVAGTYHKELKDFNNAIKDNVHIVKTLEGADKTLAGVDAKEVMLDEIKQELSENAEITADDFKADDEDDFDHEATSEKSKKEQEPIEEETSKSKKDKPKKKLFGKK